MKIFGKIQNLGARILGPEGGVPPGSASCHRTAARIFMARGGRAGMLVRKNATSSISILIMAIFLWGLFAVNVATADDEHRYNRHRGDYNNGGSNGGSTGNTGNTGTTGGTPAPGVSINSTSRNRPEGPPSSAVPEQPIALGTDFQVVGSNDLGMHCGDLDTRVSSILPPFNVIHSQVIRKGQEPEILGDSEVDLYYSAASNPTDPALTKDPMLAPDGSLFKTNFWDTVNAGAYDPFYPPPPTVPALATIMQSDLGLPVPDPAFLYPESGSPNLVAEQQTMPGILSAYSANLPQPFKRFDTDLPFFVDFPFGYRLTDLNWFSADGIPLTTYDDFGRLNSYPLMRLQAVQKNSDPTNTSAQLATLDVVVPISGEASCANCHASTQDGGNGSAINGIDAATAEQDPQFGSVPPDVSVEWATDTNILRLHDLKEGTELLTSQPVVCQTCHYTPALDLANVGPLGGLGLDQQEANGREQRIHASMSRVMHEFHGQKVPSLALELPPLTDPWRLEAGVPVVKQMVQDTLNQTCYQCHPGKETKCLRGAMFNGGMVCQDCHGNMKQVGNDFTINMSANQPYPSGADLTKRVPWADEPRCQSCHTGDAVDNLNNAPDVIPSSDGIRLLRAYRTNDPDAKPIIAFNKRFAENQVGDKTILYRLSKGHQGVFCEACHGGTHAEWPNANPAANDNIAAMQLQGHTGTIIECSTCHTGTLGATLEGPHGMHPVGGSNSQSWVNNHENFIERNGGEGSQNLEAKCGVCHGIVGNGTVLAKVTATRTVSADDAGTVTLNKGDLVSCGRCHGNPFSGGGRD